MLVLINSSKTMRRSRHAAGSSGPDYRMPMFQAEAGELAARLQQLSPRQLKDLMHLSPDLSVKSHALMQDWSAEPATQTPALDAFRGDIYRGLDADGFDTDDRAFADDHLRILSGLYGVVRPLDGITPYRLELMYGLSGPGYKNLYEFWRGKLAPAFADQDLIINLASEEYFRAVVPELAPTVTVVAPRFISPDPKTGGNTFVAIHAKVARGAMARWIIKERVMDLSRLRDFTDDGQYRFDTYNSTAEIPTFVRQTPRD